MLFFLIIIGNKAGIRKTERGGASRGRENFQQKIICDRIPASPPSVRRSEPTA